MGQFSRRSFLTRTAATAAAVTGEALLGAPPAFAELPTPEAGNPLEEKLDGYVGAYMPAMNAPGMTLALADSSATVRAAGYGYADVALREPVTPAHLFQIGSITKSFVALVLLQLRDEGKLDLHKPVLDYLPWLPVTEPFGPITTHHLLTHTSGLPDNLSVFQSDPSARLAQGFTPGEHFHYCNSGFDILGELATAFDGRLWRQCVQARILTPLGMDATRGIISTASRARQAIGYEPYWDDQVYARQGKLAQAPNMVMDDTAGCIASTPGDMALYLRMLLNRGQHAKGRIVSEESFTLFSTPYIKSPELSPTADYGYGIAVDTLEGHKILRHTGGMVAFASSIHVDLDGGVAAFASINAMQGYRPTAITEYAVRLLRARKEAKPLPELPKIADPTEVENAADYAGTYTAASGATLVFAASGKHLTLISGSASVPLQHAGGDAFLSTVAGDFAGHAFVFGRNDAPKEASASAEKPAVVEVSYGPELYTHASYAGPKTFTPAAELLPYAGHYRSDSPWGGSARVFFLKGLLTLEGAPLTAIGDGLFRPGDEAWNPDTAEFLHVAGGKARLLKLGGMDFWRVEVD
jgi:CubicO group peptidase (beta-lactamase class C family)